MKLDLAWIEPMFALEGAREELVRLMKVAIVAVATQGTGEEDSKDEQYTSEDRS